MTVDDRCPECGTVGGGGLHRSHCSRLRGPVSFGPKELHYDPLQPLAVIERALAAFLSGKGRVTVKERVEGFAATTYIGFKMDEEEPEQVKPGDPDYDLAKERLAEFDASVIRMWALTYRRLPNYVSLWDSEESARRNAASILTRGALGNESDCAVREVEVRFLDGKPAMPPAEAPPITYDAPSQEPEVYGRNPDGTPVTA